jgi:hypothetical protein
MTNARVEDLLDAEQHALTADDVDDDTKRPGQCWRTQRLVIESLGLRSPGAGLDAKQAGRWYRTRGYALKAGANTLPGDLYFWFDGAHGHVAMRVNGNKLGENSSVHSTDGSDARGWRLLREVRPPDVVIRLIKAA